jgi:hypothetical protein
MYGVTSAARRNSMHLLRDQIDQRLVSFGFTNANAKSPVGRMRYAESLQRNVVAHDLRAEMTQQLSPAPKPRNTRTQPIFIVCRSQSRVSFF